MKSPTLFLSLSLAANLALGGARGYEAYADMKGDWIRALRPSRK